LHIAPQLAIYSRAKRMWVPGGMSIPGGVTLIGPGYIDTPCVRQDVGVIVHVRDGKAVPYFVDLNSGWEDALAAVAQLKREQRSKKYFAPVPNIIEPKPAEVLTEVAVAGSYASPYREPGVREIEQTTNLATAMLDASKMTATALGPAPMPPNGYAVGDKATVGGIEFTKHADLPTLSPLAPAEEVREATTQIAVERPDGMVEWTSAGPDEITRSALENIAKAPDLASLAETFRIWTEVAGRTWDGAVARAGEARRRILECPQRALHTSGSCACGWKG
jgi:hypothetical protein